MDDPPPPSIPPPFSFDDSYSRLSRNTTQIFTKYPKSLIYNSTNPLSSETHTEDIYTIPLIREHHNSYLYHIDTHSLVETPDEPSFSIPFTSPLNSKVTFRKNIYPTIMNIPFALDFTTFLKTLSEKNNHSHQHAFTLSAIQALLQKETLFDLPNNEQLRTYENIPHHWLTTDILQNHHFQYQFSQNLSLNIQTKEQIRIYSLFLRNFCRHNFQLLWDHKFQYACGHFPSQFTKDERLPFLAISDNRHLFSNNFLDFPVSLFNYLLYDTYSIDKRLEHPPPSRPQATRTPQIPSFGTTSDVSLQTIPSPSNVSVNTHKIGTPPPSLDPPPPPSLK